MWTIYKSDKVIQLIIVNISLVSHIIVPFICFTVVKFHQVDQVMRQFGFHQSIPTNPLNLNQVHKNNMKGRTNRYWPNYHKRWTTMWND